MIPYMELNEQMNLNEQVDSDFSRARRRTLLRRVLARLRRKPTSNRLLSFEDVRGAFRADNWTHLGRRVVEVEKIVDSVGRWSDFDPSFLPTRASVGERWKRIDRAFHRGEDLLPVELYKIGQAYFVVDGHHRFRWHATMASSGSTLGLSRWAARSPRRPGYGRSHGNTESLGNSEPKQGA